PANPTCAGACEDRREEWARRERPENRRRFLVAPAWSAWLTVSRRNSLVAGSHERTKFCLEHGSLSRPRAGWSPRSAYLRTPLEMPPTGSSAGQIIANQMVLAPQVKALVRQHGARPTREIKIRHLERADLNRFPRI